MLGNVGKHSIAKQKIVIIAYRLSFAVAVWLASDACDGVGSSLHAAFLDAGLARSAKVKFRFMHTLFDFHGHTAPEDFLYIKVEGGIV